MYSLDLRDKLVNSYLEGTNSQEELAKLFGVSRSFLTDILKKYRDTGNVLSENYKCGRTSKMSSIEKEFLKSEVEKDKSITLADLSIKLKSELNVSVCQATIHNYLKSINMNYKKNSLRPKKRQRKD